MSDEQATELIHLRHRLRAMVARGGCCPEASQALDRFRLLAEKLGDPELRCEHARWSVSVEQLQRPRQRLAAS